MALQPPVQRATRSLVSAGLAAASRALRGFDDPLSRDCLQIAQELWERTKEKNTLQRVEPAVELLLATKDKKYADFLVSETREISQHIEQMGWIAGRSLPLVNDQNYTNSLRAAVKAYRARVDGSAIELACAVRRAPCALALETAT